MPREMRSSGTLWRQGNVANELRGHADAMRRTRPVGREARQTCCPVANRNSTDAPFDEGRALASVGKACPPLAAGWLSPHADVLLDKHEEITKTIERLRGAPQYDAHLVNR